MAEELGKIIKPEAKNVEGKKKLCVVPLLYYSESAPAEYQELFKRYWDEIRQQIDKLESKLGTITHVYHESIVTGSKEGLEIAEKLNPTCFKIIDEKCKNGATMEATEDKELSEECMDWERCLFMGFISQKVARMVSDFYVEASRKRYESIANILDSTLKNDEFGVIFIREGHMVQFPPDIEVFNVAPPVLDEIHRWRRDYMEKSRKEETPEEKSEH